MQAAEDARREAGGGDEEPRLRDELKEGERLQDDRLPAHVRPEDHRRAAVERGVERRVRRPEALAERFRRKVPPALDDDPAFVEDRPRQPHLPREMCAREREVERLDGAGLLEEERERLAKRFGERRENARLERALAREGGGRSSARRSDSATGRGRTQSRSASHGSRPQFYH